jgi:hypothetical protein
MSTNKYKKFKLLIDDKPNMSGPGYINYNNYIIITNKIIYHQNIDKIIKKEQSRTKNVTNRLNFAYNTIIGNLI